MDPIRIIANTACQETPGNIPSNTSTASSFLERVKRAAQNALTKFDEIFDKIGFNGRVAIYTTLMLSASAVTIFVLGPGLPAICLGVSVLALNIFLALRHRAYATNQWFQKLQPIEQELTKFNQRCDVAQFKAQLDICQTREEFIQNLQPIKCQMKEIKDQIEALAKETPENNAFVRNLRKYFDDRYKSLQMRFDWCDQSNPNDWQASRTDVINWLEFMEKYLKEQLDSVRHPTNMYVMFSVFAIYKKIAKNTITYLYN